MRTSEMRLTLTERAILSGETGTEGARMALEIVVQAARVLGAGQLVPVTAAHIDGCLYHGTSGTLYCERLCDAGARVSVPSTTNVGALNLLKPAQSRLQGEARKMAYRLMVAHEKLGCQPSWTCAPYQTAARPTAGQQVAWGESNAVAFCNSVLGARTNRYGDFLDIACAISGRAPFYGLHVTQQRYADMVIDVSALLDLMQRHETFAPVLGALVGAEAGSRVCAVTGWRAQPCEDTLKAFCAAAAATGAVGLVHIVGITPEAPDLQTALGGKPALDRIVVTPSMMATAAARLTRSTTHQVDAVALGSPHFSADECLALLALARGRPFKVPVYVCLGRHVMDSLVAEKLDRHLEDLGVEFVVDTCVVVTPILPEASGVLMTNSAKFAHYATGNTGYLPAFGSLADCVASAQAGHLVQNDTVWA